MSWAGIKKRLRAWVVYAIEDVSLTFYSSLYLAVIFIFAEAYLYMPDGNGLLPTIIGGQDKTPIGFSGALYFSATTITTVCYGDIDPIGFSRALAAFEALLGLTFFGIMLAKITSMRLSYHVLRLFGSYAENRLDQFCLTSQKVETHLRRLSPEITKAFPDTPGTIPVAQDVFLESFGEAIGSLHLFSGSFCQYLSTELDEGFFFADAPKHALIRSAEDVQRAIYVLTQLFIALSPQARIVVLDDINLRRVTELLYRWKQVSERIINQSKNAELKNSFKSISDMCSGLLESFFSVPASKQVQPGQDFQKENEQKIS